MLRSLSNLSDLPLVLEMPNEPPTPPRKGFKSLKPELKDDSSSILEDVLPSFQMHDYMFNRTIYGEPDDSSSDLPDYSSEIATLRSILPVDPYEPVDSTAYPGQLLLNNIDKLPTVVSPLNVKIVLTKRQPKIGKPSERESPITEFKPGDLVTGYVTLKSSLNEPFPFEMLLISLEGELKTPGGGSSRVDRKIVSRTFLKMYDLNACYHIGNINIKAYGVNQPMQLDTLDNTVIGFDDKHGSVLPGVTHKKFFTFKLPYSLLDTTCQDQLNEHLQMLPSFGFDDTSLKGFVENLEVDPALGYKRCEEVYGSPIKVNDTALKGQSISYFIKVQMIGKKNLTTELMQRMYSIPYVIFSNEKFYFRVNVSKDPTYKKNDDMVITNKRLLRRNIRTSEQITRFERFVVKTIEELKTKKQLYAGGVRNKREQDEMIAALAADESKKFSQLPSSTNFHEEIIRSDSNNFLFYESIPLSRDLLGRQVGDVILKASMSRNSQINAVNSFSLTNKHKRKTDESSLFSIAPDSLSLRSIFSPISGRPSSAPLRSLRSTRSSSSSNTIKSLPSLTEDDQGNCFVEFELTFVPENQLPSKSDLPSSITVSPSLKFVNIYSTYPIPVSIDGEFLMDEQLIQYTMPCFKKTFSKYLKELKELANEVPVPRSFYNNVNAMSKLTLKEAYVQKFEFKTRTIDLQNKWEYDEKKQVYKASVKVPLSMSFKQIHKSTICLVPTFESCLVNQFYMVHFHVTMKKTKKYSVFKFPIKVV